MNDIITSHSNSLVKRVRRLRQRKYRQEEGAYFVEGPRLFLAAAESGAVIEHVLFSGERLTSVKCYEEIERLKAANVAVSEVSGEVFQSIAEADNPAGIGAIVSRIPLALASMSAPADGLFVTLLDAADPGNVGTILRTLDAAGGSGLILSGNSTDPTHPTSVKASMGAIFTVPAIETDNIEEVVAWARTENLWLIATSAHAEKVYWGMGPTRGQARGVMLVMGSERHGLPPDVLAAADEAVTIPMSGSVTSLNLAVATALLVYELKRGK